jgi:hypothetical protein
VSPAPHPPPATRKAIADSCTAACLPRLGYSVTQSGIVAMAPLTVAGILQELEDSVGDQLQVRAGSRRSPAVHTGFVRAEMLAAGG